MSTEVALVQSLFNGLAFSFPVAALVLIYATQNVITSFFAVLSVGSVVVSVLGFCKLYMGWSLECNRNFAGIIVVGLAVDYVVHQRICTKILHIADITISHERNDLHILLQRWAQLLLLSSDNCRLRMLYVSCIAGISTKWQC